MDGRRFDDVARAFARRQSRRGLVGTALAVWAGFGTAVRARAQGSLGLPPGSACSATSECAPVYGCVTSYSSVCADNGIAEDGALNCCVYEGGQCGSDAGCCAGLTCVGEPATGDGCVAGSGRACRYPGEAYTGPGSPCQSSEDCGQDGGAARCAEVDLGGGVELRCCRDVGGTCVLSRQCCGAAVCAGGACVDPTAGTLTTLADLNLRAEPVYNAAVLLVIPQGATVTLTGQGASDGWVSVDYAGTTGWVSALYLA